MKKYLTSSNHIDWETPEVLAQAKALAASDVLKHRTGYCYSKNHLLAALLRVNKIPTGLCY